MNIEKDIIEIQTSNFGDYSKEVNLSRSIPDVRDGFKLIQRRILFGMDEMKLSSNKKYSKCAGIVGKVISDTHPHGDTSIYDALVGMTRDYSNNIQLIDGHGNFGNIYGSSASAYRYTEARLTKFSEEVFLDGIDNVSTNFVRTFDNSGFEPEVLPCKIPNILINGSFGIGVGVVTAIPPHNPKDIINISMKYLNNLEITNEELIKGLYPSLPTGGIIINQNEAQNCYRTGNSKMIIRSKFHYEEKNNSLVMTEIPYLSNYIEIKESIINAINDKKILGIKNIEESGEKGKIRLVIFLRPNYDHELILNQLITFTKIQSTLTMNLIATNKQKLIEYTTIKDLLKDFFDFRIDTIKKIKIGNINKLSLQKHLQEGLIIALDPKNIDSFISTVKNSSSKSDANEKVMTLFNLTMKQAEYLTSLEIHRLNKLEINTIKEKIKTLEAQIKENEVYLTDPKYPSKIIEVIKEETLNISKKFFNNPPEFQTEYMNIEGSIEITELIKEEKITILLSKNNYIRTINNDLQIQKNARQGKNMSNFKDNDYTIKILEANSIWEILLFSETGKVYIEKVYNIPKNKLTSLKSIIGNDSIISAISIPKEVIGDKSYSILVTTLLGKIKRVSMEEFSSFRQNGTIFSKVGEGDKIINVELINEEEPDQSVFITNDRGYSIRMTLSEIPSIKRPTYGVNIFGLSKDEDKFNKFKIVNSTLISNENDEVVIYTDNGLGKRVSLDEFDLQKRMCVGKLSCKLKEDSLVSKAIPINSNEENTMVIITSDGKMVMEDVNRLSLVKRPTFGQRAIKLTEGNKLVDAVLL